MAQSEPTLSEILSAVKRISENKSSDDEKYTELSRKFEKLDDKLGDLNNKMDKKFDKQGKKIDGVADKMGSKFDYQGKKIDFVVGRVDKKIDDQGKKIDGVADKMDNKFDDQGKKIDGIVGTIDKKTEKWEEQAKQFETVKSRMDNEMKEIMVKVENDFKQTLEIDRKDIDDLKDWKYKSEHRPIPECSEPNSTLI